MVQLSKILGSILRDMISAQHEANMYSLKLSSAYQDLNQATVLNPPSVYLGDVDLTLHCGFSGDPVTDEFYTPDTTTIIRTLQDISSDLSEIIVSSILSTVIRNEGNNPDGSGPIERMDREKTLRKNFIAFLSRKLAGYLKRNRTDFITAKGKFDLKRLQQCVLLVADKHFLSHPNLNEIFANDVSCKIRQEIRLDLQTNLQIMLPRLLKNIQPERTEEYPALNVTVSSEELSKFPGECIQTLRLKISSRDLPIETDTE